MASSNTPRKFGFVYPGERRRIPSWVLEHLTRRLLAEPQNGSQAERLCRGGLLSRAQYLVDFLDWNYQDARLPPHGPMSAEDLMTWTQAAPAHPRASRQRKQGAAGS